MTGVQPEDLSVIDYEREFAQVDLAANHWQIVGPASLEEFQALGRARLEMLKGFGLRPDSRVLDVGCGTGSFTGPLSGFLGDDGFYLGTDLSEHAVRFCRARFVRPNFAFAKNGMTTLPTDEGASTSSSSSASSPTRTRTRRRRC